MSATVSRGKGKKAKPGKSFAFSVCTRRLTSANRIATAADIHIYAQSRAGTNHQKSGCHGHFCHLRSGLDIVWHNLFHNLSGNRIRLVTTEDEEVAVADDLTGDW